MAYRLHALFVSALLLAPMGCVSGGSGPPADDASANASDTFIPDVATGPDVGVEDTVLGDSVTSSTDAGASSDSGPADQELPPTPANGEMVNPACPDGQYEEVMPDPTADISTWVENYDPATYKTFILEVLAIRYPVGALLVEGGLENQQMGDCIDFFLQNKQSAEQVISQLSTAVHECGHFLDVGMMSFGGDSYFITEDLMINCEGGNKFEYGGQTFVRSKLTEDAYSELYPPCPQGAAGGECDFYGNTYLTGKSGDQGFNTLFEEAVQYVNSLATAYAFHDYYGHSASERDGIMTFLWYLQRYLRLARMEHPDTYDFLSQDPCWRNAILTLWGRAWLYLYATEDLPNLGINDAKVRELVMDPLLLQEIEDLRAHAGCL